MTDASLAALHELRSGAHFEWTFVNLLAVVLYVYSVEIRAKRWDAVVLGLGFWAAELVWEIINGLVLHFSGYSAMWTVAGKSVFVLLVGLNVEIYFMFAIAPIVLFNLLPADRSRKIAGIPNRWLIPALVGLFCVAVETVLNRWGALVWSWPWWRWPTVEWIVVAYVAPFLFIAWAYDRWTLRTKVIAAAGAVVAALASWWLFVVELGWV